MLKMRRNQGKSSGWNVPLRSEQLDSSNEIPFQLQAEHLAEVVSGEASSHCSGQDGLNAVRVCEAVIAVLKSKDGLPVKL